jgi:hypothetical protein
MRLKADLLLFMIAIIWGTAFVAQSTAGRYGNCLSVQQRGHRFMFRNRHAAGGSVLY